ncbi:MAG: amidohydrolase family protein [bacterium]
MMSTTPAQNRKRNPRCLRYSYTQALLFSVCLLQATTAGSAWAQNNPALRNIDTHIHLDGIYRSGNSWLTDFDAAAATALAAMDEAGVKMSLLMPPPFSPEKASSPVWYDYAPLAAVAQQNPERFAFMEGGGSLNPIIYQAWESGEVTGAMRQQFEEKADEIALAGAAGFGEMAAMHLSFNQDHPILEAPPDHPLFLLLADIAARHDIPIDLHMEAVAEDMPLPSGFAIPPNPDSLRENISAFERLLIHNREAKIVWAHVGWDNTGHMTVDLLRRLLTDHSNLYMAIKFLDQSGLQFIENRPVDENGSIRPEWLQLISDFPNRFVMGADEFFGIPGLTPQRPPSLKATWSLIDQLPEDLARKVGYENVERLYKLTGMATTVHDAQGSAPGAFRLDQNYPNPFNPTTTIPFSLFRKEHVTLKMFDVLGREVATLIDGEFTAGEHSAVYHAERLTSGVYFYRLKSGREVRVRKLLLLQ